MIGIIFINNLKYCPYIDKYVQIIDSTKQQYEVLYWNREKKAEKNPQNFISFDLGSDLKKHPICKSYDFIRFKRWLKKEIRNRKYNKLILLSTLSGVILEDVVRYEYNGKYIFDIRDYSYENNKLFFRIVDKLISDSYFTCISSKMFTSFLPNNYPYVIAHNYNSRALDYRKMFIKKKAGEVLNIVWVGEARYFDHQVKIINRLKDDNRFTLTYHGSGPELYRYINYCNQYNITEVRFSGEYSNQDKHELYNNADILNNSYNTRKVMEVKYAISNKYYDGLIYGIMQLVETNTYKHRLVEEKGLGVGLEPEDEYFADKLYNYYHGLNEDEFNHNCEKELESIVRDDLYYLDKIRSFVLQETRAD